ncbi:MAG TPA: GldG family protein, partial [Flavisolibacter sp.]|nr:GldG family protein [Flavisolibacter sp.]
MGKSKKQFWWIALIAGLIVINFIAAKVHSRFDLTEEKRYSLTSTTKDLMRQLDGPLTVYVFLKGDIPAEFRRLSNTSQEFLSVLKETNPSKINYRLIDPQEEVANGKTWADTLNALGAAPINLSVQVKSGEENKIMYPYALVTYQGQPALINLFQSSKRQISAEELNNAEAMMEYEYARTIDKLIHPEQPFVAYATGNGEPTGAETYDLQQVVSSNYKLFTLELNERQIPDTMKALLIVKP